MKLKDLDVRLSSNLIYNFRFSMTNKFSFLFSIFLFNSISAFAQTDTLAHNIKLTIKNFPSSKAYLCYYYGSQTFLLDSVSLDSSIGFMHFKSRKKLPDGMYFIATKDIHLLDFIIAGEKNIVINTTFKNLYDSADVQSQENRFFFEYMRLTNKTALDVEKAQAKMDILKRTTKDKKILAEQADNIRQLYKNSDSVSRAMINTNSTLFVTKLLKAHQPLQMPENINPYTTANRFNPEYGYYYRQHFWDNFDFSDARYLHAPFYTTKVDEYLQNTIPKQPDSLNLYVDLLLSHTKITPEYFKYTLRYITQLCEENLKNALSENLLVHLVDVYHRDTTSGTDKYTLERLDYKANSYRSNLIGKKAPIFSLPDSSGKLRSFQEFSSAYTLIIFFSAQCTHCQVQIPQFRDVLQFTDSSVMKTYTVCTDGTRETWLPFIEKNKSNWVNVLDTQTDSDIQKSFAALSLPIVYLLDKDKKIIAKYITPDMLKKILEQIQVKEK